MKGLASASFFYAFNRVVRPDPLRVHPTWSIDGVEWCHSRHAFRCEDYEFSINVYIGEKAGKKGWRLMVIQEGWWATGRPDPCKNVQTAHVLSGDRKEALAWFRLKDAQSHAAVEPAK